MKKLSKTLTSQYNALEQETKDIARHLTCYIATQERKVNELLQQLKRQQQAAKEDRMALELQCSQEIEMLQEQVDKHNSKSRMQAAEIEALKEEMMQVQELSDTQLLGKLMVSQKEEHEATIQSLKIEIESKKAKLAEYTLHTVDSCIMPEVSSIHKKASAQHSKRLEEIQFLQGKSTALKKEINTLQDSIRDLSLQRKNLDIALYKSWEKSIIHKNEVKKLQKVCQQLMLDLTDCCILQQHTLAMTEFLRQHLVSVSDECCQKTNEAGQLEAELQKERSKRRKLENVKQEAAIIFRHILTDSLKVCEWKIQRLLEIVESCAPREQSGASVTPLGKAFEVTKDYRPPTSQVLESLSTGLCLS
ncbi:cilia- and flagella-associated protein 157 [Mastacembelus armatus]|uniref:cilia- and flagella-associated protein 157 n=1 Tax=Mastacembelus armatus TaxID=205130 RepID=UPI001436CC73|nr:FYVE and coiled-coil domain-containing protein 1-like [Mastacembelus armatus]